MRWSVCVPRCGACWPCPRYLWGNADQNHARVSQRLDWTRHFFVLDNVPASRKAALDTLAVQFHQRHRQTFRLTYPATDLSRGVTNLTKVTARKCLGLVFLFVILSQYDKGWDFFLLLALFPFVMPNPQNPALALPSQKLRSSRGVLWGQATARNTVCHLHHRQELIAGKLLAGCRWKLQQHRRMLYGGLFCSLKTHCSVRSNLLPVSSHLTKLFKRCWRRKGHKIHTYFSWRTRIHSRRPWIRSEVHVSCLAKRLWSKLSIRYSRIVERNSSLLMNSAS